MSTKLINYVNKNYNYEICYNRIRNRKNLSGRGSVRQGCVWSGKCPSGKCPSGKCLVGEVSGRGNVRRGFVRRGSVRRGTVRTPNHHPAKFDGHGHHGSEHIIVLVFHVSS